MKKLLITFLILMISIGTLSPGLFGFNGKVEAGIFDGIFKGLFNLLGNLIKGMAKGVCIPIKGVFGQDMNEKCVALAPIIGATAAIEYFLPATGKTVQDTITNTLKEYLRKKMLDYFTDAIVKWIQGVDDKPAFVTNWREFMSDVVDDALGTYIETTKFAGLCDTFDFQVRVSLPQTNSRPALPTCTLNQIVNNIENFYGDFRNGGWLAFNETLQPQNNPYGAYIMAMEGAVYEVLAAQQEKEQQMSQSTGGFLNTVRCKQYWREPLTQAEICLEWESTTPGGVIADKLSDALKLDTQSIITAKEFEQYATLILDAVTNRLFRAGADGLLGLTTKSAPEKYEDLGYVANVGTYTCDSSAGICILSALGTYDSLEECNTNCTKKYICDEVSYTCIPSEFGEYNSKSECDKNCNGQECNIEPELCSNINVYVRGQKCDGPLSNCAVVGPNNINPTCCDIFCSHMRDVMYPQATALHSWDWDDSKDNGIISAICKYAGVPVQSECHCSISNMGGACFTGIPKSKCGNPLAGKYPEYDKGLLICKGEPPYCVSDTKEEPTCADCTNMYVRGRLGGAKTDACEGGACPICSGTRYVNSRNGVCEAFCLHTKEFLWGKEGLPSEKQFTKQEIINKGFESLFTHLSESIPNEGCYCQRPLTNSTFADGYICYDCIPVQGKNLEENESMDWEFSVCKGSAWCDANCSD
jgi:hypothetical protein